MDFPCPNCRIERESLEAPCLHCGWSPVPVSGAAGATSDTRQPAPPTAQRSAPSSSPSLWPLLAIVFAIIFCGVAFAAVWFGARWISTAMNKTLSAESRDLADEFFEQGQQYYDNGESSADFHNAVRNLTRAIELDSSFAEAYNVRALTYHELGDREAAIRDYNQAIRLEPDAYEYYNNRGVTWHDMGDYAKAIDDFSESIRLESRVPHSYCLRALSAYASEDFKSAKQDLEKAVTLDPFADSLDYDTADYSYDVAQPKNHLARFLATCPDPEFRDGPRAVELASEACQDAGFDFEPFIDTLAAAHAENENFAEAIKWQTKAIEEASLEDVAEMNERLKLYKQDKPYRASKLRPY